METTADLRIAAIAAQQFGVFTVAQALASGLTHEAIRHRVASGRWGRMHRGVFRMAGSPPTYDQVVMAGWLAAGESSAVSFKSAGRLLGYPVKSEIVELTVPRSSRRAHRGLVIHQTTSLTLADRTTVGPLVATSPTRTLIDLAGVLDERRLVACVDFATSKRLTVPRYIRRRMAALGRTGRANFALLEHVLDTRYPHGRAPESVLERSLFDLLGELPCDPPIQQYWVRLSNGDWVRLDGAWPDHFIAIEADSFEYHSTKTAWALDGTKRTMLVAMGWRILSFKDFDVSERPEWVLQQAALARGIAVS